MTTRKREKPVPSRKQLMEALEELLGAADDAAQWIAMGEEGNEGSTGEDSWFAHNAQFDKARGKAQRILGRAALTESHGHDR